MTGDYSFRRPRRLPEGLLVVYACARLAACGTPAEETATVDAASIRSAPSETIVLPTLVLEPGLSPSEREQCIECLAISPQDGEYLARGPEGFDIRGDGTLVVVDPLRDRLVFYDAQGTYLGHLVVGIAAMTVTALDDDALEVRGPRGESYILEANELTTDSVSLASRAPINAAARGARVTRQAGSATLDPATGGGTITWPEARGVAPLSVLPSDPDAPLVSLGSLAVGQTERGTDIYVTFETARDRNRIDIEPIVRVYDSRGNARIEVRDIPHDYYVPPVTAFRVHGDRIYQLYCGSEAVRIHVWEAG